MWLRFVVLMSCAAAFVAVQSGIAAAQAAVDPSPNNATSFADGIGLGFDQTQALPDHLQRQVVPFSSNEKAGTIIVDTQERVLYFLLGKGRAIRYGIGVPREGLEWSGKVTIGRKAKWPVWTPTAAMIRREPSYAEYASGMPGGPGNPLGARALYLHSNGRDTLYRIHGTSEPWTIGKRVSSGCLRLLNAHAVELYDLVRKGSKVIVK